jgi:hypothetical protein
LATTIPRVDDMNSRRNTAPGKSRRRFEASRRRAAIACIALKTHRDRLRRRSA